jgi:hypothetical protein
VVVAEAVRLRGQIQPLQVLETHLLQHRHKVTTAATAVRVVAESDNLAAAAVVVQEQLVVTP